MTEDRRPILINEHLKPPTWEDEINSLSASLQLLLRKKQKQYPKTELFIDCWKEDKQKRVTQNNSVKTNEGNSNIDIITDI
jgi:hypothetical protein